MIRKILCFLSVLVAFVACKDDDEVGFDVPVEFRKISFEPIPGGAVMRYKLHEGMDVFGVRATYKNAYGKKLVKESVYLNDSILLNGFTEARTGEPVMLTFLNDNLQESAPVEMKFDTKDAATVALFDNLEVTPFWGGFSVIYRSPELVEGSVHIYYVGINPVTQKEDNILIGTYPIIEGGDTLNFELKQSLDELNVVVRTDDYDGNQVKTEIYEGIAALTMEQLSSDQFTFSYSKDLCIEDEDHEIGYKYLFDGKKKGANYRKNRLAGDKYKYGTWVAGPNAFEERFIVDFKSPKIPAMLRGDVFVCHGWSYPYADPSYPDPTLDQFVCTIWNSVYISRLPCKIKVYGTNDDPVNVSLSKCALLYSLNENPSFSNFYDNAWCRFSDCTEGPTPWDNYYNKKDDASFEVAEPISLDMKCNYTGKAFRYVFFVVEDTWNSRRWGDENWEENGKEYISFDELEVFVKKENK